MIDTESSPSMPKMRLRRGMVRESCDFCHRRKIKCDRLTRNDLGHTSCSQCSLRNVQCRMDDSDDIRLRSRRQPSSTRSSDSNRVRRDKSFSQDPLDAAAIALAGASPVSNVSMVSTDEGARNNLPLPPPPPNGRLAVTPLTPVQPSQQHIASALATPSSLALDHLLSPPLPSHHQPPAGMLPSSFGNPIAEDLMFLDDPFQLNADSIFFLDKIFMGYPETPAWLDQSSAIMPLDPQPLVLTQPVDNEASRTIPLQQQQQKPKQQQQKQQQRGGSDTTMRDGGYDPPPWLRCEMDEETFLGALRAYFEYTTLHIPILLEDAFWQDYYAGRCSLSLVYAVACRGLPFTSASDKWAMQQRAGEQFREAFFEAQLKTNNNRGRVRLDDLEALALMVAFKYEQHDGTGALSQLHSHLTSLYLTHDSMVLMTMQSGIDGASESGSTAQAGAGSGADPSAPLTRLNDRRILLFWHVYGLDAFHCLDKKTLSRIPDCNLNITKNLPRHEARGYLDAVLDLSVIARKALITLSNATSRRRGVRAEDVFSIYALLDQWQRSECPPHLRRQHDAKTKKLSLSAGLDHVSTAAGCSSQSIKHIQLHRAVVWILEINCYMQVEDCVSEYGIHHDAGDSLEAEVLALRVESESVRAMRAGAEIARSILQYRPSVVDGDGKPGYYSLADLSTSIVRDCCIGLCHWACHRGSEWLQQPLPAMLRSRPTAATGGDRAGENAERKRQHLESYMAAAKALRDAAATAVSHADTIPKIRGLDEQIAGLSTGLSEVVGR